MGDRINPIDDAFLAALRDSIFDFFQFFPSSLWFHYEDFEYSEELKQWGKLMKKLCDDKRISPRFLKMYPFVLESLKDFENQSDRRFSVLNEARSWLKDWNEMKIHLGKWDESDDTDDEGRLMVWDSEDHMLEECLRVFARITEKPDGAMISLWDLLDEREIRRFVIIREVFSWTAKKTKFPVPYDPETAMFTKEPGSFTVIEDLLLAFKEWEGAPIKKT